MARLFFSYSHKDETLRNELQTHLTALKRQGILEMWHDREIGAGKEFVNEISQHLENADIILLLVSPDFIASNYVYDREVKRAMERHEQGETRVIPVILRPCYWKQLSFGKLRATPTDGKPVTKFPALDDAFLEVTEAISDAAEELGAITEAQPKITTNQVTTSGGLTGGQPSQRQDVRSSNLRITKQFTDQEKDQFLEEAFEYIANYFEGSLAALEDRNQEIMSMFKRLDPTHFTATIYRYGARVSGCQVWIGGRQSFLGGIAYSANESGNDTSFNGNLRVEDDGYALFLKPTMGLSFIAHEEHLTNEGAAELLWSRLLEPLQQ